jgi:integrase
MQRVRLTPERIRKLKCPAGVQQAFLWDNESPRLAVRATAGAKSFIFESKLNRKTIRITIGATKVLPLDEARAKANSLQTEVDRGDDPRELERERNEQKAAAKAAKEAATRQKERDAKYTLRALCNAYVGHLERRGKESATDASSAFRCHVFSRPDIADKPAREVTSRDIASLVRAVHEVGKERTSAVLRAYLSAAYNLAQHAPFDARTPDEFILFGVEHNPVAAIKTIPGKAGDRTLSSDELKQYMAAIGDSLPEQALRLALYAGGQRMAQLLRAQVADWDAEDNTLRLLDPKGRRSTPRPHYLPLGPKAAALVAELVKRAKSAQSDWLFSTQGKTPMVATTPGTRAAEICAAMKGAKFNLRDVRRTCETMLAAMGITKDIRAQLLSHGISGVQDRNYDRHHYLPEKRAALVAWEARLTEIATGQKSSNVVKMRKGKGNTDA